ncbi:unnamed protein product [Schistosoma haematobium]|nr:unnamed protein product [Schistosoma haematobium]
MNANLLHLLLAIVFTASITGIHAYRTGDLDRQFQKQRKCSFIYEFCKYSTLD